MPHRISFVPEFDVIVLRLSGELTPPEMEAAMDEVPAQSWFRPHLKLIIDARDCTTHMTGADVERLAAYAKRLDPVWGETKWAVLAPADVLYGLSRMYMALTADFEVQTHVFRSVADVDSWLGRKVDVQKALEAAV